VKQLAIFTMMLFIMECKSNDRKSSSNYQSSEIVSKIIYDSTADNQIRSDSLYIVFQSSFLNDTVKAMIGRTAIFKKVISTDQSIGLAESIGLYKNQYISNKAGCIKIIINSGVPIQVCNYNSYRFIYIDQVKNHVKILLTNKIHYYK